MWDRDRQSFFYWQLPPPPEEQSLHPETINYLILNYMYNNHIYLQNSTEQESD